MNSAGRCGNGSIWVSIATTCLLNAVRRIIVEEIRDFLQIYVKIYTLSANLMGFSWRYGVKNDALAAAFQINIADTGRLETSFLQR